MLIRLPLFTYLCFVHLAICICSMPVSGDVVQLTNGQTCSDCTFISQTIEDIEGESVSIIKVHLPDGTVLEFNRSEVAFVQLTSGEIIIGTIPDTRIESTVPIASQVKDVDPLASRYLYAPSAFSLSKGQTYISQKELFFTSAARGITDNVTLLVGSVLPVMPWAFNLITGVKIGTHVVNDFYASAGLEIFSFAEGNFGFVFGNGTYGDDNFHMSLIIGKPFVRIEEEKEVGPYLTVVGLNKKLSKRWRFVSETWFVPDVCMEHCYDGDKSTETYWMSGNVARIVINNSFVMDAGFIFLKEADIAFPWLDVTYVF